MTRKNIASIKVIGVGGAGCNAVNRMVDEGLDGVEFFVANTDVQALESSPVNNKLALGPEITGGLGAGSVPEIGKQAAEESEDEIRELVKNTDMIFVTAGLGGGTGTGAAPLFAKVAKEEGALVVGIVTKPFLFEGPSRSRKAHTGLEDLRKHVDSLIIISNNQLLEVIGNIPFQDAFLEADNVLRQGVQTITDLIAVPALINLDFADVRNVMENQGTALIGIGMAQGDDKAIKAAESAITSPLLEAQIDGAQRAIINVTGGDTMSIQDANNAVEYIRDAAGSEMEIIFGVAINESLGDAIIVTVIATGFDRNDEAEYEARPYEYKEKKETPETEEEEDGGIPDFFRNR
ncbi:MAG TPA: cell division protein FtsZ [Erysipelothrix sp.]|nr:cell division protein FtsZ [Erysipelothrix sp.]